MDENKKAPSSNGCEKNADPQLNGKQPSDTYVDDVSQAPAKDDSAIEPTAQRAFEPDSKKPAVKQIYDIAREEHIRCFRDQHGEAFAWVPTDPPQQHWECLPLKSRAFCLRLLQLTKRNNKRRPRLKELREAVSLLAIDATLAETKEINTRMAREGDDLFIDLVDETWRMVRINAWRWEVVPQTEPRFTRYSH